MFIVYDILCLIFTVLYLPYVLVRGKWHEGFRQRMGFFSDALKHELGEGKKIWFHAVSVGEVMAVRGLVQSLRTRYPGHRIILTTVTQTGYRLAQDKLAPEVKVLYAPLDFSIVVRRFIRVIDPQIYVTVETEIWPNLFYALIKQGVPILLVNGRISDGAFRLYRLTKFLFAPLLRRMSAICVQTAVDAQRFMILGSRSTSVFVTGNFKFDEALTVACGPSSQLRFAPSQLIWIAGSTHPGEEDILLKAFHPLHAEFPLLRLVIAPRHVERTAEVQSLIAKNGLKALLFSQGISSIDAEEIVVIDTIGHLRHLYRQADVVFIGKTLVGRGGQNVLEPAAFGKAIVVGPHMENFRQICAIFLAGDGLVQVRAPDELLARMRELIANPQLRGRIGGAARRLIDRNQGATQKAVEILSRHLPV